MRHIPSVKSTLRIARILNDPYKSDELKPILRTARALNDPYGSNELNLPLADRYSAGVLDMTVRVDNFFSFAL